MDSLKSLMDKRQYELVIKLTENATESTPLFYRISALLATGKGEAALECIKTNRKILEADLAMLMKIHIEILCLLQKFDEAYEELRYYENLPYVSQQVEELLEDLPKLIRDEERKNASFRNLDQDDLLAELDSKDSTEVLMALDIVRERDVNVYLNKIENVMVNFPKQSIRSFALLLLVQKQVNRTVKFNHMGNIIELNPSLLEPPFVGDDFTQLVRKLDSDFRNPALSQNAVQILSTHVLYIYPDKVTLDIDIMVEALYQISNKYLQSKDFDSLEDRCREKHINPLEVEELMDQINDSLEDF